MTLRKAIFWLHLIAGTVAGSVILLMSITGVLLTYERQIAEWADMRQYRPAPPVEGAHRLPLDEVLRRVQETQAGAPIGTVMVRVGGAPISVGLGSATVFVDPYTARILGRGAPAVRTFFRDVRDWHRWLGVAGPGRTTARAVTGACNLAFLFLVISGFYLWWPRSWSWRQLRNVIWFRRRLTSRPRDFNWHNTTGFWCSVPLFVVVLSATVISYRWSSDLVYRIAGETPPRPAAPAAAAPSSQGGPLPSGLDGWLRSAQRQVPGWRTVSFRVPAANDRTVTLTIDEGSGGEPQKRSTMTVNLANAATQWEPFAAQSPGRRWRAWLRFAHTGEAAGLAGQTVAGIASAGGALLVWTGISLAIRRLLARIGRRRQTADETESTAA